jgi:hypothetical protein
MLLMKVITFFDGYHLLVSALQIALISNQILSPKNIKL